MTLPPTDRRPQSRGIPDTWDDLFSPPEGSGGARGLQQTVRSVAPVPEQIKQVQVDGTYMEFGREGLKPPNHRAQQLRMKGQIHEIGQQMLHSMTASFAPEVWEACDVDHPDQEHRARAAIQEKSAMEVSQLLRGRVGFARQDSPRAKTPTRRQSMPGARASIHPRPPDERPKQLISYLKEREEDPAALQQERRLAMLAKHSGWSVLDVEEVFDIFAVHSHDGSIGLHGPAFPQLIQDILPNTTEEEMTTFFGEVKFARRRSQQWRQPKRVMTVSEAPPAEGKIVRFAEFFVALVSWLDSCVVRSRGLSECKLSRYKLRGSKGLSKEDVENTFKRTLQNTRRTKKQQSQHSVQTDEGDDTLDEETLEELDLEASVPLLEGLEVRVSVPE